MAPLPTSPGRTGPIPWPRSCRRRCSAGTRSASRRRPMRSSGRSPTCSPLATARQISPGPGNRRSAAARWDAWCANVSGADVRDLRIAVVGAAGLAGREVLRLLAERDEPPAELRLLGSPRTAGTRIEEGEVQAQVGLLQAGAFDGIDVAFFTAGPTLAGEWAPVAAQAGAAVIDSSSRFRFDEQVPLVVPEVNPDSLATWRERGIVASPSATTVGLTAVLAPLAGAAGLRRVVVSTYSGVASAGRRAVAGLSKETIDLLNGRGPRRSRFARRLGFNCVPQLGELLPDASTTHELHATHETRRVLDRGDLAMFVTAVRVPMFFGLALAVTVETERAAADARATHIL